MNRPRKDRRWSIDGDEATRRLEMKIDIGIPEEQRLEVVEGLSRLLADTYTLYLKTHNFHWNVTGPMFLTLHQTFEVQYNERPGG